AKSENDPLWRLPLWRPYDALLESKVADINNVASGSFGGSITAALFLRRFVTAAKAWLHVDVYAWNQATKPGRPEGGECQAARAPGAPPTHKVTALRTLVFPGPSIKLPPLQALPLGSRLAIARTEGVFAITAAGGYLPVRHLAAIDEMETDLVAVAERFLGAPYLWGGKTSLGLDCSGLVQIALTACGIPSPRDSHMQEKALGRALAPAIDLGTLRRGDLLFWHRHVAIVRDAGSLIHANAFHMAVALEPIEAAIARIRAAGSEVTSARRLDPAHREAS